MRTWVAEHLGSRQVARVVYGATIGLALVVALQDHPPTAGVMVGWLLGTAVAVALAEVFSEVVGIEVEEHHRVTRHQWTALYDGALAVAAGIAFPAAFFLLAAVGLLELDQAFHWSTWSGVGLIGCYGFWATRLAGAPVHRSLLRGGLVALVGAGLIALKALVH